MTGNVALLFGCIGQFLMLRRDFEYYTNTIGLVPVLMYLCYISLFIVWRAMHNPDGMGWVAFGGVTTIVMVLYNLLHCRYASGKAGDDTKDTASADV